MPGTAACKESVKLLSSSQKQKRTNFSALEYQSAQTQAGCTIPNKAVLVTVWLTALESPARNVSPPDHHNHVSQQCSFQHHLLPIPSFGRLPSIAMFLTPTSRTSRYEFWNAVMRNSHPYQLSQCPYCFSP